MLTPFLTPQNWPYLPQIYLKSIFGTKKSSLMLLLHFELMYGFDLSFYLLFYEKMFFSFLEFFQICPFLLPLNDNSHNHKKIRWKSRYMWRLCKKPQVKILNRFSTILNWTKKELLAQVIFLVHIQVFRYPCIASINALLKAEYTENNF